MLKRLALVIALALLGTVPFAAKAGVVENAAYQAVSVDGGVLNLQAELGSYVRIRYERPDATYGVCGWQQVSPDGTLAVAVPHWGPTADGQPQYVVDVMHPDGTSNLLLAVSSDTKPDDYWWLD